jgi:hypothetical protein
MRGILIALLATTTLIASLPAAHALTVGGGGSRRTDCLATFDTAANTPPRRPRHVRCTDGDPACDADGIVNGRCDVLVAVCANSTQLPRCTLAGVDTIAIDHAQDDGDRDFDPDFQALQTRIDGDIETPTATANLCTAFSHVQVPVQGPLRGNRCKKGKKRIRMTTISDLIDGRVTVDRDQLRLTCDPSPAGCDPRALFSGTFDRIQRQVFNQSCALSGCHDSQSMTGELLLETGAAYGNLVNATPTNGPAAAAGLARVAVPQPDVGDPLASYLMLKITGDLGPGFGARMPFGGPKLDRTLIDVIRRWIEAGAPADGWVAGTD